MTQQCAHIYGPDFDIVSIENAAANTNIDFGGYGYQASNTLFVNGKIDPWHIISIFEKKPNPHVGIIYSDETAHCAEMSSSRSTDSAQLKNVRTQIVAFLESILNETPASITSTIKATSTSNNVMKNAFSLNMLIFCIFIVLIAVF